MKVQWNIVKLEIWEMNQSHADNSGKYRLAMSVENSGTVTFGPFFNTKKEAEKFLSQCKKCPLLGYDEGFALMHTMIERLRKKY